MDSELKEVLGMVEKGYYNINEIPYWGRLYPNTTNYLNDNPIVFGGHFTDIKADKNATISLGLWCNINAGDNAHIRIAGRSDITVGKYSVIECG